MADDFMLQVFQFREFVQLFSTKATLAMDSDTWLKGLHNVPPNPDPTRFGNRPSKSALEVNLGGLQNTIPVCISTASLEDQFFQFVLQEWRAHRARNAASGVKKYLVFVDHFNMFDGIIKVAHTRTHRQTLLEELHNFIL